MSKKLAFIYLGNDLIQKSMIKAKQDPEASFNNFHSALAPPRVNEVFTLLFKIIYSPAVQDQALHSTKQILKVIGVWKNRKVYDSDQVEALEKELQDIAGINKEQAAKIEEEPGKPVSQALSPNDFVLQEFQYTQQGIPTEQIMAAIDECWIDLAEQIKVVGENREKIGKLEQQLDAEVESKEGSSESL